MDQYVQNDTGQLEKILKTSAQTGLSEEEAVKRLRENGKNRLLSDSEKPFVGFLKRALVGVTPLLFLLSAVLAWIGGVSLAAFLTVTLCYLAFLTGMFFLYRYRERKYREMEEDALAGVTVIRDGKKKRISPEELAVGDLIRIGQGDVLYADVHLISEDEITAFCKKDRKMVLQNKKGGACFAQDGDPFNTLRCGDVVQCGTASAFVTATNATPPETVQSRATQRGGSASSFGNICRFISLGAGIAAFLLLAVATFLPDAEALREKALPTAWLFLTAPLGWADLFSDAVFLFKNRKAAAVSGSVIVSPDAAEVLADADCYMLSARSVFRTDRFRVCSFDYGNGGRISPSSEESTPELRQISAALLALYSGTDAELCEKHIMAFCEKHSGKTAAYRVSAVCASDPEERCTVATFAAPDTGYGFTLIGGDSELLISHAHTVSEYGRSHLLDKKTKESMLSLVRRMKKDGYQPITYAESQVRAADGISVANLTDLKLLGTFVLASLPDSEIGDILTYLQQEGKKTVLLHDGDDSGWLSEEYPLLADAVILDGARDTLEEDIRAYANDPSVTFAIGLHLRDTDQAALAHALRDAGHTVVAAGRDFFDHRLICAADAALAPLSESEQKTAPVVYAAAAAHTREKIDAEIKASGIASDIVTALGVAAVYLTSSLLLRTVLLLFSVWTGLLSADPTVWIAGGILLDTAAVYAIAGMRYAGENFLPSGKKAKSGTLPGMPVGALCGTVCTLLMGWLLPASLLSSVPAFLLCALTLTGIVILLGFVRTGYTCFRLCYPIAAALYAAVFFAADAFGASFGIPFSFLTFFWALIPAAAALAGGRIAVALEKKRRENN